MPSVMCVDSACCDTLVCHRDHLEAVRDVDSEGLDSDYDYSSDDSVETDVRQYDEDNASGFFSPNAVTTPWPQRLDSQTLSALNGTLVVLWA